MSEVSAHPSATNRRRGRRRGVEIRPGSVKQARQESGLSLGQVARSDLSRTAIYFVETGKAKPSIETLRLIAERTNKPLEFFLGEAGGLLLDPEAALVERLLMILGHAYGQAHEYANAIRVLEESIGIGTAIQDLRQLSIIYSSLSLNNQELGQFAEAARYAHRAMAIHETLQDKRSLAFAANNLALL